MARASLHSCSTHTHAHAVSPSQAAGGDYAAGHALCDAPCNARSDSTRQPALPLPIHTHAHTWLISLPRLVVVTQRSVSTLSAMQGLMTRSTLLPHG